MGHLQIVLDTLHDCHHIINHDDHHLSEVEMGLDLATQMLATPVISKAPAALYLEDLAPGQQYRGPRSVKVDAAQIKAFANQFDPQPFHIDEKAASGTFFKGLAASGWHTAALTMRLLVESDLSLAGGIIGAGSEDMRWPRPLRPGDELHVVSEILEVRPS
jgi:acyl dehydratase